MNPLNGMTLNRIRADMHKAKIAQEAQSMLSNIRYSIEIKRSYFLVPQIHAENIATLLKNGFQVHKLAVVSNQYNTTIYYYAVFWENINEIKASIEATFPECRIEWHPHNPTNSILSRIFKNNVSPA